MTVSPERLVILEKTGDIDTRELVATIRTLLRSPQDRFEYLRGELETADRRHQHEVASLTSLNDRLREELSWALQWFNATSRRAKRDRYNRAVVLSGKPDPQAWRDQEGMPK